MSVSESSHFGLKTLFLSHSFSFFSFIHREPICIFDLLPFSLFHSVHSSSLLNSFVESISSNACACVHVCMCVHMSTDQVITQDNKATFSSYDMVTCGCMCIRATLSACV